VGHRSEEEKEMEMKINSALIKSEREKRAWSQQHLSDVTGLGLRTIQRVEATGSASYESFQAIASCLEIDVATLRMPDDSPITDRGFFRWRRGIISASVTLFVAVVTGLSIQGALAEPILLELGVTKVQDSDTHELATEIQLESGRPYELTMDNAFKFNISATVTSNDKILISVELFDYKDDEYVLLAQPKVLTVSGKEATIELGADDGKRGYFKIMVTPQVQQP